MATADPDTDTEQTPVEDARDELQDAVPEAAETLRELVDAEDEWVQIRAAEAILDRAGLTKAKMQSSAIKAQTQVGGGERPGSGIGRAEPLEDSDDGDIL